MQEWPQSEVAELRLELGVINVEFALHGFFEVIKAGKDL